MSAYKTFTRRLGVKYPIIQAPMAGASTPGLAAKIVDLGGIGSLPFGATPTLSAVQTSFTAYKELVQDATAIRNVNLNFFVFGERNWKNENEINSKWIQLFSEHFEKFQQKPPTVLNRIYQSFDEDIDPHFPERSPLLNYIVETIQPKIVSFHFGIPSASIRRYLQANGILIFATATNVQEAQLLVAEGIDGIIAQGYEAGGHRGNFLQLDDDKLSTVELSEKLISNNDGPFIISAGGIMNNSHVKSFLEMGSSAVQLGTAFLLTSDCVVSRNFREMAADSKVPTSMTSAVSGRPARTMVTPFVAQLNESDLTIPAYPYGYDLFKQLNAVANKNGVYDYGAYLAGDGVHLTREGETKEIFSELTQGI